MAAEHLVDEIAERESNVGRRSDRNWLGKDDLEPIGRACRSRRTSIRAIALGIALLPLALMFVASRLEPSSRGLGTHQQLGLPPCTTRLVFGIRCPACGMTTSWAHFVRGQWQTSAAVNLGGFLLAFYCLAASALALSVVRSGQIPGFATQRVLATTLIAVFAITITDWIWRLTFG